MKNVAHTLLCKLFLNERNYKLSSTGNRTLPTNLTRGSIEELVREIVVLVAHIVLITDFNFHAYSK